MSTEVQENYTPLPSANRPKWMVPLVVFLGVLGIVLFALFVWPTGFKYSEMNLGFLGRQLIRENRFTGEAAICGAGTWQRIEISGDIVSFPNDITVTIGGDNGCSRLPLVVTIVVALIVASEVVLVFLLLKKNKKADTLKAPANIDDLVRRMKNDPDWLTRLEAAEALAQLNDPRGLEYIHEAELSDNPETRDVAKEILASLKSPESGEKSQKGES